jgi:hypothetical protein
MHILDATYYSACFLMLWRKDKVFEFGKGISMEYLLALFLGRIYCGAQLTRMILHYRSCNGHYYYYSKLL